jgi:putative ABC transport system permease protein
LAGALVVMRVLSRLLFGVKPTDPATFALVAAILLGAAFLASGLPAVRASRMEPAKVLGNE